MFQKNLIRVINAGEVSPTLRRGVVTNGFIRVRNIFGGKMSDGLKKFIFQVKSLISVIFAVEKSHDVTM